MRRSIFRKCCAHYRLHDKINALQYSVAYMASGKKLSRKRKLPADSAEAESFVHSANTANEAVTSVHQQLRNTMPQLIDGRADALSPELLATWLVAKYGVEEIQKLVSIIIAALPTSLPSSKKEYYFKHLSN